MLVSVLRFMLRGWVEEFYVAPKFHFSYFGFEWVRPLGEVGMYVVFGVMALAALAVMLGAFYRIAAPIFFFTWTYVELLDLTNYLNHYYFVTIVAGLMIFLPAHRAFSVDVWRKPDLRLAEVPRWTIGALKLQLGMVYFFAGLAKVQGDWLLRAMPLRIWLPAKAHVPVIGALLSTKAAAFVFSWAGCLYDLLVPFALLWKKTRPFAYAAVVGFHLITWWLFPIGMFPFIMILSTLIFFPARFHEGVLRSLGKGFGLMNRKGAKGAKAGLEKGIPQRHRLLLGLLGIHFALQILMPFRHVLYGEDLFWHEQGFRFSWRVMLMEKAGSATFYVRDPHSGRESEVRNGDYLTVFQEKMMSTQPDMMLQYAHFLEKEYQRRGLADPEIYVESFVTLNGSGSRPFTDRNVDLTLEREGFRKKAWILPFEAPSSNYSERHRP
jgi:hypothetical protein